MRAGPYAAQTQKEQFEHKGWSPVQFIPRNTNLPAGNACEVSRVVQLVYMLLGELSRASKNFVVLQRGMAEWEGGLSLPKPPRERLICILLLNACTPLSCCSQHPSVLQEATERVPGFAQEDSQNA